MKYKFLRVSLLSAFAVLFGGIASGAFRAAETETVFSADVTATETVAFTTGTTEITSDLATLVGGKMYAVSKQSDSKNLIGKQSSYFMFCMTNNDTYFTVELDEPLAIGDVISAKTYTRTDTELGLFISTAESRPGTCATALTIPAAETASYTDLSSYTITEGDGLVGAKSFNIFRSVGKSTYFNEFKITRTAAEGEGDEPGTGDEPSEDEPTTLSYKVNEVAGGEVVRTTEGEDVAGASIKVPYRQYNVVDGKLYQKGVTNKEYNYTFTLSTDGQEEKIEYAATDIVDVVYLSEAEDIEGLTPITAGNAAIRSSNSAAAYAAENDVEFTKLPSGVYKLTAVLYDSAKSPDSYWAFIAGTDTIANLHCTTTNVHVATSENFTITDDDTPLYLGKGGSDTKGVDLIYIVRIGDVGEELTASYKVNEVAGGEVVRTTEGEDTKGSVVKVSYRLYNAVNGKLYKKGATNKEYNYTFTLTTDGQEENIEYAETDIENVVFISEGEDIDGLTPITTGNAAIRSSNSAAGHAAEDTEIVTLEAGVYTVHVVMYDATKGGGEVFTFKVGEQEYTLTAGENFSEGEFELTLTETATIILAANTATNKGLDAIYVVKTSDIVSDGINNVKTQQFENGEVYNLQGQKVNNAQKGIFIINGKKVVLK